MMMFFAVATGVDMVVMAMLVRVSFSERVGYGKTKCASAIPFLYVLCVAVSVEDVVCLL